MRREESCQAFQQRAGRLDKWRQLALEAAAERSADISIPDKLEILGLLRGMGDFLISGILDRFVLPIDGC